MIILCVNAGSSSLKFQVFDMPEERVLISGLFERIGIDGAYTIKFNGEKYTKKCILDNHKDAFTILTNELVNYKVVSSLEDIRGVGHRVVQGGTSYDKSVIIDDEVMNNIEKFSNLAPLHNPAAIIGINASKEVIPNAVNVAVFDTAFHQTMDESVYLYPIPLKYAEEYNIRKYGAHGTSHKYITLRANQILGREDTKLITCHIGNGASISAVKNGKCVDTSMGFTPTVGVMMGTRCGDIDATIGTYMINNLGMSANEVENVFNKESGLLGVSGVSSDYRDIEAGINEGNSRCVLARDMYVNRVVEYIAKYYVLLNGCDMIVFTAGLGENAVSVRKAIIEKLEILGIKLDMEANQVRGEEKCISSEDSKVLVYVIPTDEEKMIANDTYELIK